MRCHAICASEGTGPNGLGDDDEHATANNIDTAKIGMNVFICMGMIIRGVVPIGHGSLLTAHSVWPTCLCGPISRATRFHL
mgnify:CR=1 FL=1